MRKGCLLLALLGLCLPVFAQSDMELIIFPDQYHVKGLLRVDVSPMNTVDEEDQDEDFEMGESFTTLRYNLKHSESRDIYLTVDSYWASIDNQANFIETGESLPDELYDFSAGLLFREQLDNGWTLGGSIRLGSSSDKLFDSFDEVYLHSQVFLRVPHLEYTSWIFIAGVNTDWKYPIYPGIAYAFPISHRAYMMIGFPVLATGGNITDKLAFSALFVPGRSNVQLDYALTDRVTPYIGYTARSRFFSRADRDDNDDKIRLSDSRVFAGTTIKVLKRGMIDVRGGYAFDRDFGEGDDYDERKDNTIDIENAAFASFGYQLTF